MSNNYCQSASFLDIPKNKIDKAQAIVDRIVEEIANAADEENPHGYCMADATVEEGGVYFTADENILPDHVVIIAQALLDELEIDEPFCFSWAYTCDKQRVDEFGGGACLVRRGQEPYYVDAMQHVMELAGG